jgi:hypothetical protein
MKYLCMVVVDEKKLAAMSEAASQALTDESLAYDKSLKDHGHFIAAQALESVNAATMVRILDGKVPVTDGPFAEAGRKLVHPMKKRSPWPGQKRRGGFS